MRYLVSSHKYNKKYVAVLTVIHIAVELTQDATE